MIDFSSEGINFKIIDESLKKCSVGKSKLETQTALIDNTTKFVKIPSTAKNEETSNEYTVTIISSYAFWKSLIETVIIPFTVEEIQHAAFAFSYSLKNVVFEQGSRLATIGANFIHETNVSRIVLPPNVKNIAKGAFEHANALSIIVYCGDIKIDSNLIVQSSSIKAYVPTNFRYSSFGGIPILKTNQCQQINYVSRCSQRKSTSNFFIIS